MGFKEPGSKQGSKKVFAKTVLTTVFTFSICTVAGASQGQWSGIEAAQSHFNKIFNSPSALNQPMLDLNSLVEKAERVLSGNSNFAGLFSDGTNSFKAERAVGDKFSTTIRFGQTYQGLEVVGNEAMVHFDRDGQIADTSGKALETNLSVTPKLSAQDAHRILADRYNQNIRLSELPALKVFRDFEGKTHLVYHLLTRTTATHDGQEVFVDAHNGEVVLEFDRAYHASKGQRTVYSADTDAAREHVDARGYPTDIDMSWYEKVAEDGNRTEKADRSALNAYRNSGLVYDYYKSNFNRKSYDNEDSRIVSIVHMGNKMNNAFWTSEYKLMAYGDGDGEHLVDLTYGLDVAAHELTHGVTASTAKLVYAAESGALNESFSDFFGKMVDYTEGNWDIGPRIMSPKWNRRALRNMKTPTEFKQPDSNDSALRTPTNVPCTRANDRCGVHNNSGIPNRAAVLIVESIGKEKTEQLYYKVLTTRLSATSDFAEMRKETEKACKLMFGGDSSECRAVTKAFDTVKM